MSSTVIDSLVVTLGLDDRLFRRGQGETKKRLDETRKQAKQTGDSFKEVATAAGQFLAILAGASSLKQFIVDLTDSNAQLDRLAHNLDTTTESISAWSGAVEQAGGNGKSAQATMSALSQSMTEIMVTGNSAMLPYFRALGVNLLDAQKSGDPLSYTLLGIADGLKHISDTQGRSTANNIGKMMGIDQDTLNLLLKGRAEVELMLKRQQQLGLVTSENARQSSKLAQQWVELKQTALGFARELGGYVTPVLGFFTMALQELISHKGAVIGMLTTLAVMTLVLVGPWVLLAAKIGAVTVAIGLLADDWYTWLTGGKAAFGDFYGFVADRWHALMDTLSVKGLKKEWADFKAWIRGETPAAEPKYTIKPDVASTDAYKRGRQTRAAKDEAMAYFQSQGWTRAQAAGIVANAMTESKLNPGAVGDSGNAYGIAQWHPDRQANFRKWSGKDIRGSSLHEQLAFLQFELTQGTESAAGSRLRMATTAAEAGGIVSRHYERPRDAEGEAARRARLAASYVNTPPPLLARTSTNSTETNIGTIQVFTQASDAPGIARDIGGALRSNTLVTQSDTGVM